MMRQALAGAAVALAMVVSMPSAAFEPLEAPRPAHGTVQTAFAPWNDIEGLVVEVMGRAKKQILLQAYLLTSKPITQALIQAHRRGVQVRVLLDAEQLGKVPASKALMLTEAGIPVWLETNYQNAHNKVVIIDASSPTPVLITGSFNFTWAAAHKNAENVLVVRGDRELAMRYSANWERHQHDAVSFRP
jgi:phosphatidylserine/phosphatidylglycerophosphate/cardiolipin synthase-like enzyme